MKPVGDGVKGEIQLSFKYDFNNELLLIKVIKCRELSNRDIRSKMADTFVKVRDKISLLLNTFVFQTLLVFHYIF